ncbi:MAG TPA: hypothetical protein VGQ39_10300 [Pyrinomonadaceae bacterium]|jgi:hypothetical protein|nr:hypothetical protein [Pyrinomonadaceae bacterium]
MPSQLPSGTKLGRYEIRSLLGAAERRFHSAHDLSFALENYSAVTADGQRFILNNLIEEAAYTPITVVLNWTGGPETLKA